MMILYILIIHKSYKITLNKFLLDYKIQKSPTIGNKYSNISCQSWVSQRPSHKSKLYKVYATFNFVGSSRFTGSKSPTIGIKYSNKSCQSWVGEKNELIKCLRRSELLKCLRTALPRIYGDPYRVFWILKGSQSLI